MPQIKTTKRLRVFAGPNGSGKSTIINAIREIKIKNRPIDLGIYINADDIAKTLRAKAFTFQSYSLLSVTRKDFIAVATQTGLINMHFPEEAFKSSFSISKTGMLTLRSKRWCEYLAQVIAAFLREKLLQDNQKFSFETVFSHPSKIDFMREAAKKGYKVYLYFIATESPEINIFRIKKVRVKQGGHDVPDHKIKERYTRSLELMYDAAEVAYQAFFFDNSLERDGEKAEYFAHFKKVRNQKVWDPIDPRKIPTWFAKYYLGKV